MEKRFLRALAHHLEPVLHVGKEGISPAVLRQLDEVLERHELVKVKVQREAPVEAREAAERLAQAAGASVAQVVGRVVVLYRERREEPTLELPRRPRPGRSP